MYKKCFVVTNLAHCTVFLLDILGRLLPDAGTHFQPVSGFVPFHSFVPDHQISAYLDRSCKVATYDLFSRAGSVLGAERAGPGVFVLG